MSAEYALKLLRELESARLDAIRVFDGVVPDGTPESVRLGKAEVALDQYDTLRDYYRAVDRDDAVATEHYVTPRENRTCDQCGCRSGRHEATCPRNRTGER